MPTTEIAVCVAALGCGWCLGAFVGAVLNAVMNLGDVGTRL